MFLSSSLGSASASPQAAGKYGGTLDVGMAAGEAGLDQSLPRVTRLPGAQSEHDHHDA